MSDDMRDGIMAEFLDDLLEYATLILRQMAKEPMDPAPSMEEVAFAHSIFSATEMLVGKIPEGEQGRYLNYIKCCLAAMRHIGYKEGRGEDLSLWEEQL